MQEKIRTIHVYFEDFEPETDPIIDADPPQRHPLGTLCVLFLALLCLSTLVLEIRLSLETQKRYDMTIARVVHLEMALHPTTKQIPLFPLPRVSVEQKMTVTASGSIHQNAVAATGLITFYNGVFTAQSVPAGTILRGRDDVEVVTNQTVLVPAATATTPPTYGTVSVTATARVAGNLGNIAASDIDATFGQLLAQNLYAFSGGQDATDRPVLTKADLSTATQTLTGQVALSVNTQIQQEVRPGTILLDQGCHQTLVANHHAGDQVSGAIITESETCTPLVYRESDVATKAQRSLQIQKGSHLVSFTAIVMFRSDHTLVVSAIAYLKLDTVQSRGFRYGNK